MLFSHFRSRALRRRNVNGNERTIGAKFHSDGRMSGAALLRQVQVIEHGGPNRVLLLGFVRGVKVGVWVV